MVKLKRVDELQKTPDSDTLESDFTWLEETDTEFSERFDKAEQEMIDGNVVEVSYLREHAKQLSNTVRELLKSGDIDDEDCYKSITASIK
jgi:hypothetical protein